jgi:hypothetical protein
MTADAKQKVAKAIVDVLETSGATVSEDVKVALETGTAENTHRTDSRPRIVLASAIGAIGLVIGGILYGGLYETRTSQMRGIPVAYRVNRFTGTTSWCIPNGCREIPDTASALPAPKAVGAESAESGFWPWIAGIVLGSAVTLMLKSGRPVLPQLRRDVVASVRKFFGLRE